MRQTLGDDAAPIVQEQNQVFLVDLLYQIWLIFRSLSHRGQVILMDSLRGVPHYMNQSDVI